MGSAERLKTRLRLRPIRTGDEGPLHAVFTLPDVRRYLWDDEVIPRATTESVVHESAQMHARDGTGLWLAFDGAGALAGFCGFWPFHDQIELLYGLVPAYFGCGLATEMGFDMLHYGFDALGMQEIVGSTDVGNVASVRVMERLGMMHEGTAVIEGLETTFYRLKRDAWLAADSSPAAPGQRRAGGAPLRVR